MILLDTDAFTLYQFGHARLLQEYRTAQDVPAITVITQIEALRGRFEALLKAKDGDQLLRVQQGLVHVKKNLALFQVVGFDHVSAAEFDRLREIKKLKKIGRADLLIASISLAHNATLVTRNLKHFRQIPRLLIENWAD